MPQGVGGARVQHVTKRVRTKDKTDDIKDLKEGEGHINNQIGYVSL